MASLQELLAKKEAIDREIELTQRQQRNDAIAKVRALMSEYGLTVADLSAKGAAKSRPEPGRKVAAKYRNTATGETWSGRGLQPKWLKAAVADGRKLEDFAV